MTKLKALDSVAQLHFCNSAQRLNPSASGQVGNLESSNLKFDALRAFHPRKETDGRQFSLGEADGSVRRTKRAERLEIGLRNAEHAPSRVCTLPAAESRVRIPLENEIAG